MVADAGDQGKGDESRRLALVLGEERRFDEHDVVPEVVALGTVGDADSDVVGVGTDPYRGPIRLPEVPEPLRFLRHAAAGSGDEVAAVVVEVRNGGGMGCAGASPGDGEQEDG